MPTLVSWVLCVCIFSFFSHNVFLEFLDDKPVSIATLRNLEENEALVTINSCNNLPVDHQKMNVNVIDAIIEQQTLKSFCLISSQLLNETSLDICEFVVGCEISGKSCLHSFKWLAPRIKWTLLQGKVNILTTGVANNLVIDFYFRLDLNTLKNVLKLWRFYCRFSH